MASLRRLRKSPYFVCCFTLPDGRRTNRSTKTSDRRLANRLADEWQSASDKARAGVLVEAQTRKVLDEIRSHVGQEPLRSQTVESYFRQWLNGKGDGSTSRRYSGTVNRFLAHLDGKKSAPLTEIGHQEVLGFMEKRAGVAPKTLSVDLRTLSAAFNLAKKLGLVLANPVDHALAIRPIVVQSSRRDTFSADQVKALVDAADGDWKIMILLGYYTGARLSDCADMKFQNVDFVQGVLDFTARKTGTRVVVPIHLGLGAHLQKLDFAGRPETFLCPALAGKRTCGNNGLSLQFRQIMLRAGIDARTGPGMGIRQFAKLSFHSLRHSFNSALANAGVAQETRMKLTGHSSIAVNGDYTHLELPKLRAAVGTLPQVD